MRQGSFLPVVAAALLVLALAGLIIFKFPFQKLSAPTATPIPTSTSKNSSLDPCTILTKGSQDFPALYEKGVTWSDATESTFEVAIIPKSQMLEGCSITSEPIYNPIRAEISQYYNQSFQNTTWELNDIGDVPGQGSITWYNGQRYFFYKFGSVEGNSDLKIVTLFLSK